MTKLQILHGDQTKWEGEFYTLDHAPPHHPQPHPTPATPMPTRDDLSVGDS